MHPWGDSGDIPRRRATKLVIDRATRWALGTFGLAGTLGALFVAGAARLEAAEQHHRAAHAARGAASALEARIERSLSATHALAAAVRQRQDVEDFEALASEMISIYAGIRSLQLAPAGVVRRVHPLAGNEAAVGHDLFADPRRRADAEAARASRALTVSGPFELRQGGVGLVGRYPVFLPDAGGGERFWGFTIALLSLEDVLAESRLRELERAGYAFALYAAGDGRAIARAGRVAPGAVNTPVRLSNAEWRLAVAPANGWGDPARDAGRYALVTFLAGLCAAVAHSLARRPERLRALVAERTSELERAHACLQAQHEERARAEEQLRQAQKMDALGQLAGGVAHDFNNLLTGILSCADEIRAETRPGSPAQEAAITIEQAGRRAAELTRQLLGFARRGKLCIAPVDVHAAILEVTRLLGRTLDPGISIVTALDAAHAVVLGDCGQLQQVVLNLAVNARDAMPHGGILRIETARVERGAADLAAHPAARPGPYVALSVSDTGEGVPPEILERVFEPFFTTKEPGRGTGLGLATVYGIAVNHGGFVEVGRTACGGARFTVFLPAHEGAAAEAAPGATPVLIPGARALVVDDEATVLTGLARCLARLGCEATICRDGDTATRQLASSRFDVAIVDLGMPGLDGLATFRALRSLDPALPVVITSGYGPDGRAQEALDAGASAFLQKPWMLEQLAAVISAAVAARRAA